MEDKDLRVYGLYEKARTRIVTKEESVWTRPKEKATEWKDLGEKLIKVTFYKDMLCPERRVECSDEQYRRFNPEEWEYYWNETEYTYDKRELPRDKVIIKKVEGGPHYLIVPKENTALYAVELPDGTSSFYDEEEKGL